MKTFFVVLTATFALSLANGCTYSKSYLTPESVARDSEIVARSDADRTVDVIVPEPGESGEAVERSSGPSAEAAEEPRLGDAPVMPPPAEGSGSDAPVRIGDLGPRDGDALPIDPNEVREPARSGSSPFTPPTEIHPDAVRPNPRDLGIVTDIATEMGDSYTATIESHGTINLVTTDTGGRLQLCQGSAKSVNSKHFHCFALPPADPSINKIKEGTQPALVYTYDRNTGMNRLHIFAHSNLLDAILYVTCPVMTQDSGLPSAGNCRGELIGGHLAGDVSPVPVVLKDGTIYVFYQKAGVINGGPITYMRKALSEEKFGAPKEARNALSFGGIWFNPSAVVTQDDSGEETITIHARDNDLFHGHMRKMVLVNPAAEGTEAPQWFCWTFDNSLAGIGDTEWSLDASPTALFNKEKNIFQVFGKSSDDKIVNWTSTPARSRQKLTRSHDWNQRSAAGRHQAPVAILSRDQRSIHAFSLSPNYPAGIMSIHHHWDPDVSEQRDQSNWTASNDRPLESASLNPSLLSAGIDNEKTIHLFAGEKSGGINRVIYLYAKPNADGSYTWTKENLPIQSGEHGFTMIITPDKFNMAP